MKATHVFATVWSMDDAQKLVVANGLQDKVSSLNEPIGLSRLAKAYKPFLWVTFKRVDRDNKPYLRLVATDPETLDDVFVDEVFLDFLWQGVNDQNSAYPLFNAFVEWTRANP